jgi:hypothetical protein
MFKKEFHYLGDLCEHGHEYLDTGKSIRLISKNECVECKRIYRVEYGKEKRKQISEYNKSYVMIHKQYFKKYREEHRGIANARSSRIRATKINATPPYANLEKIKIIYRTAQILSKMTGTKYHVDHIIPLNSKLVCGLHVENNLQIITEERNLRKSNRFEPIIIDF